MLTQLVLGGILFHCHCLLRILDLIKAQLEKNQKIMRDLL